MIFDMVVNVTLINLTEMEHIRLLLLQLLPLLLLLILLLLLLLLLLKSYQFFYLCVLEQLWTNQNDILLR